jgi:release factor glutamine methyltransferase
VRTVQEVLNWAQAVLHEHENAYLEAQILLAFVLECDRSKLITWPEERLAPDQILHFTQLIERRAQYEPISYLVGEKEFWSHTFVVTPDVLVPRPETEKMIEVVLEKLPASALTICDVGTGSGAIACTLALERPAWKVFALDISERALEIAKLNAERLHVKNIEFLQSDFLSALEEKKLDAIISNPPYLSDTDPHLEKDLNYEPRMALVAGKTGLEAYEALITQARSQLKPGGYLFLEHGFEQAEPVRDLLKQAGFSNIETYDDLSGHPRMTVGSLLNIF